MYPGVFKKVLVEMFFLRAFIYVTKSGKEEFFGDDSVFRRRSKNRFDCTSLSPTTSHN